MPALLTTAEAAAELGISVSTLLRRVAEGQIPFQKLGTRSYRFDRDQVLVETAARKAKVIRRPLGGRGGLSPKAEEFFFGQQARGGAVQPRTKRASSRG